MTPLHPKAVVLLSGGLDSTVTAALAQQDGHRIHCVTVSYGQRHRVEIERAQAVAKALGAAGHVVVTVDLRAIGGSALTADVEVPKDRAQEERAGKIPITYVPARNTIFLSFALAWAEVLGARDIFIGVNAVDYSGYPDCRPEFIDSFVTMLSFGFPNGPKIKSPLLKMTKPEIAQEAYRLGITKGDTWSCYRPKVSQHGIEPCNECDACVLHNYAWTQVKKAKENPTHKFPNLSFR